MTLRTIVITILCAAFLSGCGSSKTQSPASPVIDHGLAQPPPPDDPALKTPLAKPESHTLAAGTVLQVRSLSAIDSAVNFPGFLTGAVEEDVMGADGKLAIPSGSNVAIAVRKFGRTGAISTLQLGLYSINIAGTQYSLSDGVKDASTLSLTEDAGRGPGHSSVHLEYGQHMTFKLDAPVNLH